MPCPPSRRLVASKKFYGEPGRVVGVPMKRDLSNLSPSRNGVGPTDKWDETVTLTGLERL
jgi:hypothetical protein